MGKYTEDARELLALVGGKENVAAVTHCMTRMRFVLGDPKKADVPKIEAMKVVKGSFTQRGSSRSSSATRSRISTTTSLPSRGWRASRRTR